VDIRPIVSEAQWIAKAHLLTTLAMANYRSPCSLVLPLDRLNLATAAHGSGKCNLDRALRLWAETAQGGVGTRWRATVVWRPRGARYPRIMVGRRPWSTSVSLTRGAGKCGQIQGAFSEKLGPASTAPVCIWSYLSPSADGCGGDFPPVSSLFHRNVLVYHGASRFYFARVSPP